MTSVSLKNSGKKGLLEASKCPRHHTGLNAISRRCHHVRRHLQATYWSRLYLHSTHRGAGLLHRNSLLKRNANRNAHRHHTFLHVGLRAGHLSVGHLHIIRLDKLHWHHWDLVRTVHTRLLVAGAHGLLRSWRHDPRVVRLLLCWMPTVDTKLNRMACWTTSLRTFQHLRGGLSAIHAEASS